MSRMQSSTGVFWSTPDEMQMCDVPVMVLTKADPLDVQTAMLTESDIWTIIGDDIATLEASEILLWSEFPPIPHDLLDITVRSDHAEMDGVLAVRIVRTPRGT